MPDQQPESAKVGVSVLVTKGDTILLEKRAHVHGARTWGPPSGHINFGEAPEHTAARETQEETGVSIKNITFLCVTNDVFTEAQKHYITLWFEAEFASGELKVQSPEEESDARWFHRDALPQPLFLPLQHLLEGKTYQAKREGEETAHDHD
ncbi:MAG TPA: NUDIX domain-containing protein [Ktedonobacteraceae bacterium]|jgi:8-oxo-dGTP diphosphatase|nr:NUDIX domain-containing protein [Ktedonobacteraceae bacterium]